MAASTGLEKYLKERRPLRPLQFESMYLTVSMLETFLNTWKLRYCSEICRPKGKEPNPWFMNEKGYQDLVEVNREKRRSAAVILGKVGGLKGGRARAMNLSAKRRTAIARAAAKARWAKNFDTKSTAFDLRFVR